MRKINKYPFSQEELREIMDYNQETGVLTWKVKTSKRIKVGKEAGTINGTGYRVVCVYGVLYQAHRLVWYYVYGTQPEVFIDHVNGCRSDNRIVNLREATASQNGRNTGKRSNNTSGFKGVSYSKDCGKYQASVSENGKSKFLGYFHTPENAYKVYCDYVLKNGDEFSNIDNK